MSNPFLIPGSPLVERERKRRESFRIGVYAILGAATAFLSGMLIQGCQRQQKVEDASNGYPAALSTNPATASAEAGKTLETNSPFAANTTPPEPLPVSAPPLTNATVPAVPPLPSEAATAVPANSDQPPVPAETVYKVKRGDTLTHIARTHKTTVKAIKTANGLKTDRIFVGQELKLPPVPAASASPTQT